jgi:Spy/CpxP family protein refolding chaperone
MRSIIRPILSCLALGLVAAPPSGAASAEAATPGVEEGTPAPARTPHGFVQMMGEAIAEVTLLPDQEAKVEALGNEIEPLQAQVDHAENAILSALADQVEAGRIDDDALGTLVDDYVAARRQVSPEIRRIVEDLHAILDPDQRADFADALESEIHDVRLAILSGERFDAFAKDLGLDADQIATIEEGLKDLEPGLSSQRNTLHQIIEAFRGDDFSVEQILPLGDVSDRARGRAERIIHLTASLLDVLDPAQRAKLAEHIREAAQARSEDASTDAVDGAPTSAAIERLWAGARAWRGPFGGVRGGVVVGGAPRYYYGRTFAYPYAAGWGYGW